ncbi:MAG: cytochrome-c peroxidase [Chitinophagales bacterium]|nr:cytochrome-c peroxidase [Chitinophagales bacterium]
MKYSAILISIASFLIIACQPDQVTIGDYNRPDLPQQNYDYMSTSAKFQSLGLPDMTPQTNQLTDAGATLGRVLFYDKMLSVNNATSCGSCHHQSKAFSDIGATSVGFRGGSTFRNSLSIANIRSMTNFFWDLRAQSLEDQVMMPVKDHIEMGMERVSDLPIKLAMIDYYPELFTNAFGSEEITQEKIGNALAQFLRSMVSADSKFDQGVKNGFSNFSAMERRGFDLFSSWDGAGCVNCHSGNNFDGWSGQSANIGLDLIYEDKGVPIDGVEGFFKVPGLRNVALTGPYMHDGRFETLEEVVDHYNDGVQPHENLDWRLLEGGNIFFPGPIILPPGPNPIGSGEPKRLNLSDYDKQAIVAFLKTLTDHTYISDEKYSDPF